MTDVLDFCLRDIWLKGQNDADNRMRVQLAGCEKMFKTILNKFRNSKDVASIPSGYIHPSKFNFLSVCHLKESLILYIYTNVLTFSVSA